MKNIFNFLKKKKKYFVSPELYYKVYDKIWAVEESVKFKSQSIVDNTKVYGWTLEIRWERGKDNWCEWQTHYNNRIYNSSFSATDAGLKFHLSSSKDFEWRIRPIYVMDNQEYRDFKIDKLLDNKSESKDVFKIKGWKIKEDCEIDIYNIAKLTKFKKGSLFIQMENGSIFCIRSKTKKSEKFRNRVIDKLITLDYVDEVKIEDEKWSHPHLIKEIRNKLN